MGRRFTDDEEERIWDMAPCRSAGQTHRPHIGAPELLVAGAHQTVGRDPTASSGGQQAAEEPCATICMCVALRPSHAAQQEVGQVRQWHRQDPRLVHDHREPGRSRAPSGARAYWRVTASWSRASPRSAPSSSLSKKSDLSAYNQRHLDAIAKSTQHQASKGARVRDTM